MKILHPKRDIYYKSIIKSKNKLLHHSVTLHVNKCFRSNFMEFQLTY